MSGEKQDAQSPASQGSEIERSKTQSSKTQSSKTQSSKTENDERWQRKAEPKSKRSVHRPAFLDALSEAYNLRRKSILMLTGDITGLFWSQPEESYVGVEQTLVGELSEKFNLVRLDIAGGVSFYDDATEREVIRISESTDGVEVPRSREKLMKELLDRSRNSPLAALVLLKGVSEAFDRARTAGERVKPLCVVIRYAGALLPAGDFAKLSEIDRQRVVLFLNWIAQPSFRSGPDFLILLNEVRSEINTKIASLPATAHVEIQLPEASDRRAFVEFCCEKYERLRFEGGRARFIEDSAGLTLTNIEDLIGMAARTGKQVTRDAVVAEVNRLLEAELGEIIRIKYPHHGPDDIVGYEQTGQIIRGVFERCEDPETAVSAMIVSGPNGGGKTFQLEAFASESGRVVVELAGIRGSYFGETDRFFELLRWHIATFGKILILVDEAHTAFGSVHRGDTHQTEQRLSGNIIKMMGDPRYFGKVLWGLMTSRPDELDPDIKSRSPIQIPIFDLEGEERASFVREMFGRKDVEMTDAELQDVLKRTSYYSARDYRNLVAETLATRRTEPDARPTAVLEGWQASRAIERERELQTLIAALHCSYPQLLPPKLRAMGEANITLEIDRIKHSLRH